MLFYFKLASSLFLPPTSFSFTIILKVNLRKTWVVKLDSNCLKFQSTTEQHCIFDLSVGDALEICISDISACTISTRNNSITPFLLAISDWRINVWYLSSRLYASIWSTVISGHGLVHWFSFWLIFCCCCVPPFSVSAAASLLGCSFLPSSAPKGKLDWTPCKTWKDSDASVANEAWEEIYAVYLTSDA